MRKRKESYRKEECFKSRKETIRIKCAKNNKRRKYIDKKEREVKRAKNFKLRN